MKTQLKTVWLSDIHIGCKDCKAELLLNFLQQHQIETLYLVGDIIDFWSLKDRFYWPDSHNKLLQALYKTAQSGTKVIYIPGNHDELVKPYADMLFGDVEIKRRAVHVTEQGKRLLVTHGDDYDGDVCYGKFHAWLGDKLYDFLLFLNRNYNKFRAMRGGHYWSLASYIKKHVKKANEAIARYRTALLTEADKLGLDGVVCGHIHHPEIVEQDGLIYCNDGDWIENCSALIETYNGELELIYWTQIQHQLQLIEPTQQVA